MQNSTLFNNWKLKAEDELKDINSRILVIENDIKELSELINNSCDLKGSDTFTFLSNMQLRNERILEALEDKYNISHGIYLSIIRDPNTISHISLMRDATS